MLKMDHGENIIHGSSFLGLSDVKMTISLFSAAISVIIGLFPLSLSPPHPKTMSLK